MALRLHNAKTQKEWVREEKKRADPMRSSLSTMQGGDVRKWNYHKIDQRSKKPRTRSMGEKIKTPGNLKN